MSAIRRARILSSRIRARPDGAQQGELVSRLRGERETRGAEASAKAIERKPAVIRSSARNEIAILVSKFSDVKYLGVSRYCEVQTTTAALIRPKFYIITLNQS